MAFFIESKLFSTFKIVSNTPAQLSSSQSSNFESLLIANFHLIFFICSNKLFKSSQGLKIIPFGIINDLSEVPKVSSK